MGPALRLTDPSRCSPTRLAPSLSLPCFGGEGNHELPARLARRWTHDLPPRFTGRRDSRTPSPVRGRGRAGWGFGFAGLSEAAGAALRPCVKLAVRGGFWAVATFFWPKPHRRRIQAQSRRGRRQSTEEISRPTLGRRWGAGHAPRRERPASPAFGRAARTIISNACQELLQ